MKSVTILFVLFVTVEYSSSSWLSDVFAGLDESAADASSAKEENLRKIFVKFEYTLRKNIGKWRLRHGNGSPNLLQFVLDGNDNLKKDLKVILRNIPPMHLGKFMKKLNKFLDKLSKGKANNNSFMQGAVGKTTHGSSDTHKNTKKGAAKKSAKLIPDLEIKQFNHLKKKLQKNVKQWTQPSFMKFDDSNNTKKFLKEEKSIQTWIGNHFKKPHHLSMEEIPVDKLSPKEAELLEETMKADIADTINDSSLQEKVKEKGIANTLIDGLLDERNTLAWDDNAAFSKLTKEQRNQYMEAEKKWEIELTKETQRLLDKLQPADAYVIPDMSAENEVQMERLNELHSKKIVGKANKNVIDGGRLIKKEVDKKAYTKEEKQKDAISRTKQMIKTPNDRNKGGTKYWKTLENKLFAKELAAEEREWVDVEKVALNKIRKMEKHLKKH